MSAVNLTITVEATEATISCMYPRLLGQRQLAATKGQRSRRATLSDRGGASSQVAYADYQQDAGRMIEGEREVASA